MSYSGWDNMFDIPAGFGGSLPYLSDTYEPTRRVEWVPLNNIRSIQEAYRKFSPLAAVVMKLSAMMANGKFEVLNRRTQNYTRGEYKEWDILLANPNFLQTRTEFIKQLDAYCMLNGWCYAMPIYPSGFNDRPTAIFLLPPWCIEVEPIRKPAHKMKKGEKFRKVWFNFGGYREELDESKLILFKDSESVIVDPDTLLPESRIKNLLYPLSNGIGGMQSRNSLINDRGASGILANAGGDVHGPIPMNPDEQERLERLYKTKYGLTPDKKSSIIITEASLKWQPMTFDVKQLALHEEEVACTKAVCDVLGYQFRLLSTGEGATYANAEQDKVAVYNDVIIPRAQAYMEQLNAGLNAVAQNIEFRMCYDHVPVLQKSEKEKGEGRMAMDNALEKEYKNGIITRNMWLEKLGEDTVEGPLKAVFDKYIFELTPEERGIIMADNNQNQNDDGNKEAKSR